MFTFLYYANEGSDGVIGRFSKNSTSYLSYFKRFIRENKDFLKTRSFEKASCSISFKSVDFKYF